MEDYTYFLNSVKNGTNMNNNDKKRFSKERRPYTKRDYKDYDNPQPKVAQINQRKLISYDDL